jgi:3-isopropylmalate/(R)-2-methylmalate dehydratase small subunit
MEPFKKISSIATPLDKVNVDTDQIIPKQFLKLIQKTGFGQYLFYDWRFKKDGTPNKDFVLNDSKYKNSKILLTRSNFGCGSSREHAVWALLDFGFKAVISTSFADIFYNNCFKNGILPITVNENVLQKLFESESAIEIDLEKQTIRNNGVDEFFHIEHYWKRILLEGLDDIAVTLKYEDKISKYESTNGVSNPRAF